MTTAAFIGTFDPTHGGHIGQLLRVHHSMPLLKILILVDKHPAHKPSASSWQHRVEMAKLTLESSDVPFQYEILAVEDSTASEVAHRIDYKITGIDSFIENTANPSRWAFIKRWPLIILSIPGIKDSSLEEALKTTPTALQSSLHYTYINERQAPMMNYNFQTQSLSQNRVHATHIRSGDNNAFIPPPVQEYIRTHRLYETF